jgi:acyl dehydratase
MAIFDSTTSALDGIEVGDTFPEITLEVTQSLINRYAAASLDFNPVHIDPAWCERAQVFGRPTPVLHGMAQMSLLCSLVLREWGPLTRIRKVDGKFTLPMFLGDTLTFSGVVTELHPLSNGNDYVVVATKAIKSSAETVGVTTLHVELPLPPAQTH